jgi:uncharacterized delta-60 repeat protein
LLRSVKFTAAILSLFLVVAARGQSPLDGFDPNANGAIQVVVVQPDGKILLGGGFTTLSPNGGVAVTRNRIARLNPDGTLDAVFNPNADFFVNAIALQEDGSVLVGGAFANIGGQPRNRFARLNATTGIADSLDPNANGPVWSIAVQSNGKILVGGQFTAIGGQSRNRIARLDAITGLADSFDANANASVYSIIEQADNKILLSGAFTNAGGQSRNRIARVDATTGLAESFNPDADNTVFSMARQADGKILVGGAFTNIGGQARSRIARIDPVTGFPDSFDPSANNAVTTIAVQADGKILVGGPFGGPASIGGQTRNHIARIDPASGLVDSFDPNAGDTVWSIAVQPDGKVVVGGSFNGPNGISGQTRNFIGRLETDGKLDQTLNLGFTGTSTLNNVLATAVQPDGKIIIGGSFTTIFGVSRLNIARINPNGTLDLGFDPNANNFVDPHNTLSSIAVQADGKILVGGYFNGLNAVGGQNRNFVARLDAVTGLADSFDPNANALVHAIVVQADGKILVGGRFSGGNSIGGQARNRIARLDPGTGLADSFDPDANSDVTSILVQPDGMILVVGHFTRIGGMTRNRIARLDPMTGVPDPFDPNSTNFINSIALQPDGKILVGGNFDRIGGQSRWRIARLDSSTGLADSFDPHATNEFGSDGEVFSIVVQGRDKILVGGYFTGIGGQIRNRIARLDAVTGLADSFNPNVSPGGQWGVNSIAVQADGKLLVGGIFDTVGGQMRGPFARLANDTAALQNLATTQTSVVWRLDGSSPKFTRVTFEFSRDNVQYVPLSIGAPIGDGVWTVTGLSLPSGNNYIRARGYYRSGQQNGSESIMESVRNAFIPAASPTPSPEATPIPEATPMPSMTRKLRCVSCGLNP